MSRFLSIELIRSCIRIATPLWIGALAGIFSGALRRSKHRPRRNDVSRRFWRSSRVPLLRTGLDRGLGCYNDRYRMRPFHAVVSLRCRANQVISGVAINMLMSGLTIFLMQILFGNKAQSPTAPRVLEVTIPWFDKIPIIGANHL